jgi:hypothetical protein
MRSERPAPGRWLRLVLLALCAATAPLPCPAAEVVERILAVADTRPLLLSEVRVLERVRGLDQDAALEALIDEDLMYREAARVPQAVVTALEEERAYESLLEKDPGLATTVPEPALRRLARRQASIVKYVAFRFRPQIHVEDAEVLEAFEAEYAGKPEAPPLESVAGQLGERLAARALDERIEAWVKELRAAAAIRYNRSADGS